MALAIVVLKDGAESLEVNVSDTRDTPEGKATSKPFDFDALLADDELRREAADVAKLVALGGVIRKLRISCGLTLEDAARRVQMSEADYSALERGLRWIASSPG